jgi:hypothetical protein
MKVKVTSTESDEYPDEQDDLTTIPTTYESEVLKTHKNYKIFSNAPKTFLNSKMKLQNGKEAGLEALPWTVALFAVSKAKAGNKVLHCAGTLISNDLIVTAAHCVPNKFNSGFQM